jgi:hypothetical protein
MLHLARLIFFFASLSTAAFAQVTEQPFYLYGEVWDLDSKALLRNVLIRVVDVSDTTRVLEGRTDDKGRYEMGLPFDRVYTVHYIYGGYLNKFVSLDLNGVDVARRNGDHGMNVGVAMIKPLPAIDYSTITSRPFGNCKLNSKGRKFVWDEAYSLSYTEEIQPIMELHEKQYKQANTGAPAP